MFVNNIIQAMQNLDFSTLCLSCHNIGRLQKVRGYQDADGKDFHGKSVYIVQIQDPDYSWKQNHDRLAFCTLMC